ncbi:hypothetical protein Tco_1327332 [Tanacetum coccineum]
MKITRTSMKYWRSQWIVTIQINFKQIWPKRRKRSYSPRTPSRSLPPPPPSIGAFDALRCFLKLQDSTKLPVATHQSSAWTISDTRYKPSGSSVHHLSPPEDQQINDDPVPADEEHTSTTPEPAWVIPTSHILDVVNNWANALATTYQALTENSLLEKTRDMRKFINWYCQKVGKTELTQAGFEGQAYEALKTFYSDVIDLQLQMEECHKMLTDQTGWANPEGDQVRIDISRPLPLSGPLGHGSGPALSISKMKATRYPDFGLELLVPENMWINDVCTYVISASYGISHWWFNHQRFYIDDTLLTQDARANYREYTIAEKDFKNLYPSDFEDLNLLLLHVHLNHLPSSNKRMLSTVVNLWTRNLVIRQRVEDLQLGIESYQK